MHKVIVPGKLDNIYEHDVFQREIATSKEIEKYFIEKVTFKKNFKRRVEVIHQEYLI